MKLSEIDATLREIRVSPVKTLGQNFLHDRNLARWIVEKAELSPGDYVVEIGPGLGALTEFILESGARVLAIEKDQRLAEFLRKRFGAARLEIIHGDALEFDVRRLFAESRVKLLGNLPYYIASQLLLKFTKYPSPISLWLLMLQKEMARRISAAPGTSDYGALSLVLQLQYRVEFLRSVPATVFVPAPDVDSAFVRIAPRRADELPPHDPEIFFKLVRQGFSQRRKQLRNLLRKEIPDWGEAAMTIGFDPRARAEQLSLEQWIALSNRARPPAENAAADNSSELFTVVDENDRIVSQAPRGEVHGNNLRHRAIHAFIFNGQGELFLQKRTRWKDRHPLLWDSSAAGHVEVGEDYDETAARELEEELGVKAELIRVVKLPCSERTGWEFIWLYRGQHDGPFTLARTEIEHGEFFPVEIVERWLKARPQEFAPGFLECWNAFQGRAG
ncbi:MAG TPA: 16S rRNA (adenine(1518)-N(6)/adenine(1519)-N(6))-dimethyltransferase RsmA [Chthoniobacterales bacterium]|jgi:16S rRNA (adenine1518-N6/adenine1519-N6)-dimethyltransferase|nr:16S rRNA (adenine(1518)-N(6)/adenine(1519)-N(6))-dimethyltransferase RsmA [Chthoniobacterales bacterium]